MTALEKTIVKAILARLNAMPNCRAKKHHGDMYGSAELDVYGCISGRAFFLEVKRPGGKPTKRQDAIIREWESAGAMAGCVSSADEAEALVTSNGESNGVAL